MIQPNLKKLVNWNEKIMLPVIFIGPVLSLPQVYNVWFEKNDGVSFVTWLTYFITQIFWLIHAFKLNDKQNIWAGILWLLIEFLIIFGLIVR